MFQFFNRPTAQQAPKVKPKLAWELAKRCDLANHQMDEVNAKRYADKAIAAAGYPSEAEARRELGLNVAYYFWQYNGGNAENNSYFPE